MFLVCKFLADREQFRAFLFLVCIFFADQEHLGAYTGALIGNCRVVGKLMWRKCMLQSNICSRQTYVAGECMHQLSISSSQDSMQQPSN